MRFLIIIVAILATVGCQKAKDKYAQQRALSGNNKRDANRIYTTPANRLFFLNVRSLYYDKESNEKTQLDFYRYGDRIQTNENPVINLAIVDAKVREEAYLVIEPNNFFVSEDSIALRWEDSNTDMKGYFTYIKKSPKEDYEFLKSLYPYLLKQNISISYKGEPMFDDEQTKVFRKTFKDFEKLIAEK